MKELIHVRDELVRLGQRRDSLIRALVEAGQPQTAVADAAGVTRMTVHRIMKKAEQATGV